MAASSEVTPEEISIKCLDGITIAGQKWVYKSNDESSSTETTPTSSTPKLTPLRIFCVHGWMDNSSSFYTLAPRLIMQLREKNQEATVIAVDLPGHGKSDHRSADGPSVILAEYEFYISECLAVLGWDNPKKITDGSKLIMLAHSWGCCSPIMHAASFPEQVAALVLLEGAGPPTKPGKEFAEVVKKHVTTRRLDMAKPRPPAISPSLDAAVMGRVITAKTSENQFISKAAAKELVLRSTKEIVNEDGSTGLQFLHDTRLLWPQIQFVTPDQCNSLYKLVKCKVCLLLADHGMWPIEDDDRLDRARELLNPTVFHSYPGNHHFHMDPDTSENVVNAVAKFVSKV